MNIWLRKIRRPELWLFKEFNLTEAFRVFQTYKKISVVRHPLTRILSAWRDKLGPPTEQDNEVEKLHFLAYYLQRINGNKNNNSTSISLLQFLRHLVSERHNSRSFNEHWRPLSSGLCHYCKIDYDFIIKLESVGEELPLAIRQLTGRNDIRNILPTHDAISKAEMFEQLKKIPSSLIFQVLEIYRDDFIMFGYEMPKNEQDLANIFESK